MKTGRPEPKEAVEIRLKEKSYYTHDLSISVTSNGWQWTTINLSFAQACQLRDDLTAFLKAHHP